MKNFRAIVLFSVLLGLSVAGQFFLASKRSESAPVLAQGALAALGGFRSIAAEVIWFRADRLQVPKFKKQTEIVVEAQRCIGRDISTGSLWQRFKTAVVILSIMITWALENAIETADSMKSRGYGLKGRTAFSIYRMDDRDKYALIWLGFCGLFLTAGVMLSAFGFRYFPSIRYAAIDMTTIPFYTVYFGLCITPVVLNFGEERKWKTIYSKM